MGFMKHRPVNIPHTTIYTHPILENCHPFLSLHIYLYKVVQNAYLNKNIHSPLFLTSCSLPVPLYLNTPAVLFTSLSMKKSLNFLRLTL